MEWIIAIASIAMSGMLGYLVWQGQKSSDWEVAPVQLGSVLAMVVGSLGLLASIPMEVGNVLGQFLATWSQSASVASGASYPLTSISLAGVRLTEVLRKIPVGHTPSLYVVHTTLVAFIAGGVSTIFIWLGYASWSARKKQVGFLTRLTRLSNIHGDSPARLRALFWSYHWIVLTWFFLIWQKWHVFGTDAVGTDVLSVFLTSLGVAWALVSPLALCLWAMARFAHASVRRIALAFPLVPIFGFGLSMMQMQIRGLIWIWGVGLLFWGPMLWIFLLWAVYRWKKVR